jgi:hypothetical protein
MSNNPFDLANYKPQLDMKDIEKARRNAYQMTRHINEQRKKGIEPSSPYANSRGGWPQDYTTEMPAMKLHKKTLQAKKRKQQ